MTKLESKFFNTFMALGANGINVEELDQVTLAVIEEDYFKEARVRRLLNDKVFDFNIADINVKHSCIVFERKQTVNNR